MSHSQLKLTVHFMIFGILLTLVNQVVLYTFSELDQDASLSSVGLMILSLFLSLPMAYWAALFPMSLQKNLYDMNATLQRFVHITDQYVITATTNTKAEIIDVSSAFCRVSGYTKEELLGHNMSIIRHPDTPRGVFDDLWKHLNQGEPWLGEIQNYTKESKSYWLEQTIIPILDTEGNIKSFMSIGVDITAKKALENMAILDSLTNIFNRRKLDQCLKKALVEARTSAQPLSLLLIDIDFFKRVNDTYGHPIGDKVLQELATLIQQASRSNDCFGRFGGEEFMMILPNCTYDEAISQAERLRGLVYHHSFETIGSLSISIGIGSLGEHDSVESLVDKSDHALYEAKRAGRNRVIAYHQGSSI